MSITLGHRSYIVSYKITHTNNPTTISIKIGKFCSLGDEITFFVHGSHRHDTPSTFPFYEVGILTSKPNSIYKGDIIIGNDVYVGNSSVIMPGVTIGDGAVIGAYSVVTKNIEPYTIVGGNPAKMIKKRFTPENIQKLLDLKWWDLDDNIINNELCLIEDINEFIKRVEEIRA
jgi:acetyltransferase-like isoleucine patch superfamily enzyme